MTRESFESELERLLVGVRPDTKQRIVDRLPARLAATVREVASEAVAEEENPLMGQYRAELAKIRRGDVKGVTDLKAAYRRRGLDV